jgi:hypothetical protein
MLGATTQWGGGDQPRKKFFLEMTPLGVQICGKSEFEIFEAKKGFPDSEKAYCVLKRKIAKMRFLHKNGPFWCKNVRGIRLEKRFSASKISNSDSPYVFTLEGSFPKNFFTWMVPLLCSSSKSLLRLMQLKI